MAVASAPGTPKPDRRRPPPPMPGLPPTREQQQQARRLAEAGTKELERVKEALEPRFSSQEQLSPALLHR
ncbi:hypothetical protein [Stenotrophomonas indicatrix]|uniref:hypothetical protein n=1 Tax=Stenotrophomonas indicatrix TaxID=2045451 RepID=UPI00066D4BFF|nr:hypothetical protein [Stenotrophomonas indicatrix]